MQATKTFFDIIGQYIIEVPIIQREYAQGRKTPKVNSIRKRFVKDLADVIRDKREIHLGFVYGKIEGRENQERKRINKEAVTSILAAVKYYADKMELKISAQIDESENSNETTSTLKFIPLDGQQRLTTLYLLHWFLYFKGAKSENKQWLGNFKYTNRKSALAFCNLLATDSFINDLKKKQENNSSVKIKELITNSNDFLKKWNKDSTVNGMLEMLNAIEMEFKEVTNFESIQLNSLFYQFDFMDLQSLNQTDELYVKMNSRGKQLSDYEHFKSWLQGKYKKDSEDEWFKNFWKKLDTQWLNYFWRNIDASFGVLDDFYYNFIKHLALMHNVATRESLPFEKLKELYGEIRNSESYDLQKITYIPLEKFTIERKNEQGGEDFFFFYKKTLEFIEKTFDTLIYLEDFYDELDLDEIICSPFIDGKITDLFVKEKRFTPSLWDTVFYYSFIVFVNDRENNEYSIDKLKDWLRFTRNLIYNTQIQNPENFDTAIKQIYKLSKEKFNIENVVKIENAFNEEQFNEEKIKLELINKERWKEPIIKAENHIYFYGQIKFLLDFSKNDRKEYDLENFKKYSSKASELYADNIRASKEHLLERFLLCYENYLPDYKSNKIFCSGNPGGLRTKNENWRLFFKGNKVGILKDVIDDFDKEITEERLSEFIENQNPKETWIDLFLKHPEAISYCKETAIRYFSENDIRLLDGVAITGYHIGLRTYCFFLEHKNKEDTNKEKIAPDYFMPFTRFWFFESKNTDGHPGCYLEGFVKNEKEYRLEIRYSKDLEGEKANKFELKFFHKAEVENRESEFDLKCFDFEYDDSEKVCRKFVDGKFDTLESELKKVCEELNNPLA